MSTEPSRHEALFAAALELPPAEQAAFLARECGADTSLRNAVEALLRADEAAANFTESPPGGHPDGVSPLIAVSDAHPTAMRSYLPKRTLQSADLTLSPPSDFA